MFTFRIFALFFCLFVGIQMTFGQTDTVYLAPDTVRRVHRVVVYEEVETPFYQYIHKQETNIFLGLKSGFNNSVMFPLYRKSNTSSISEISAHIVKFPFFVETAFSYQIGENAKALYTKHFKTPFLFQDTTYDLLDSYIEIIGNDTIEVNVYDTTYISRIDTIYSDTIQVHKNKYSYINIPIVFGYSFENRKSMYSIGIGTLFRIARPNSNNKVAINSKSFEAEKPYIRPFSTYFLIQGNARQKLTQHVWFTQTGMFIIPITSINQNYYKKQYSISTSFMLGLEYKF